MTQTLATTPQNSYHTLLSQVRKTLIEGQARIEAERVKTYWETGRLIHNDILKNKDRSEYGAEIFRRLSKDLNVHQRLLERCVQFSKVYPRLPITARGPQFSWSHYRRLISIPDTKERLLLEKQTVNKGWTAEELSLRIKVDKRMTYGSVSHQRESIPQRERLRTLGELLTPLRGELFTYQVVERPTVGGVSELLIDLGFGVFRQIPPKYSHPLKKGDFVGLNFKKKKAGEAGPKDLFTYRAVVEKVIDGDTIKVRMDLGYGDSCRQVLRLRDLDCPEIDTKEGSEAKTFVQSYVKEAEVIVVRSSKSDKYDRYLADIFVPQSGGEDLYLNNLLLETGRAGRVG